MCHVGSRIAGTFPPRQTPINNFGVRALQSRFRAIGDTKTVSYRRYGISFFDAVDMEKQLFDRMLERFPISADVPYEEIQLFMTNRDYEGWQVGRIW